MTYSPARRRALPYAVIVRLWRRFASCKDICLPFRQFAPSVGRVIRVLCLTLLYAFAALAAHAQKWKYDFIVPDNGNFVQAIHAANRRPDKSKRYRIFVRSSNYRIHGEQTSITTTVDGKQVTIPSPMTTLTAPNTSICGESWHNTQIESRPQYEGLSITSTLFINGADSTYLQDIELWCNFRDDPTLYDSRSVAVNEKNCHGNIFKNVSLVGLQNTYWTNDGGTTYLEDCRLIGTVDFICGGGTIYFNHCDLKLANRGDAGKCDIICAPATEATLPYGYVFTDCYIDGPAHYEGRYLLGRPWENAPRAVFINCCMNRTPALEGWGTRPGALPALFAEYNSANGYFELLDMSQRRTAFPDASGALHDTGRGPTLSDEEVEHYGVTDVFGGWDPRDQSEQVPPPVLTMKGRQITWDDIPEAGCYAVLRDRKIVAFTTQPLYNVPAGTREGSCYTVRCANQMGGLGAPSDVIVYPQR